MEYEGKHGRTSLYPHRVNLVSGKLKLGDDYANDGRYLYDREDSWDVVEILPMEDKPAKTAQEVTHSITDQIDVTSPDHVSIIPHEHGVTICIKKGLTTISWRHYNH